MVEARALLATRLSAISLIPSFEKGIHSVLNSRHVTMNNHDAIGQRGKETTG